MVESGQCADSWFENILYKFCHAVRDCGGISISDFFAESRYQHCVKPEPETVTDDEFI
jgi:hypothetical protein